MFSTILFILGAIVIYMIFANKITKENFDQIKEGMTEQDIRGILGKPAQITQVDEDQRLLEYVRFKGLVLRTPQQSIKVYFQDNAVFQKVWWDLKEGLISI